MDRIVVTGAGIVGLATADALARREGIGEVVVLEKEARPAHHQTGRNSGVIHSGLYYKPGSAKARTCAAGRKRLIALCREVGIAHDLCGKVVVAQGEEEEARLRGLAERGRAAGLRCALLSPAELARLEPEARGTLALHVPEAGIVDYVAVCEHLVSRIQARGGAVRLGEPVVGLERRGDRAVVRTLRGELEAARVVNCGGLHSDRLAALAGAPAGPAIVPFRGEYYALRPSAAGLVRNLIYPVPDPRYPFLGVHFTRLIHGGVECGPNAVLALAREGYTWRDVDLWDVWDTLRFPGFRRFAAAHWRMGLAEIHRSLSRRAFVDALRRLLPALGEADLEGAPSGVRAQAMTPDGALLDDFAFTQDGPFLHVLNAPSPAATAALAIGEEIADRLLGAGS